MVVLESRTELDCLIEFINDEFDDPAKLRLIWWNLCWYVGFSLCSLQDSGRFNFTDYLTLTTLHHQQIRNWTEGADEPKQGNLQVAKCRHQHRLRRSHTFLDKLVWSTLFCWGHFWSCSLAPKSWSNCEFSRKGGSIPSTANAPCVYMEVGQTTAVNGLWSLADCNSVAMLGICEFE